MNNSTVGVPLEAFNLDERVFERCKTWSALIKHYSTVDSESEVDFDEYEKMYGNDKVEDDDGGNGSSEVSLDEDEDDNENNPLNQSVMQLRMLRDTLINAQSRSNGSIEKGVVPLATLAEEDESDKDFYMQDMLDQTLPILAERERKWKESGMMNILNTFDEEKIESKVGSWLRINNSVLSTNPTQLPSADDDDDSLHSMDTARYILSNRKPRSSSCCSTIKSFRLLQSKRDALREKYAFSEDELEKAMQRHTNGVHARHKLKTANVVRAENKLPKRADERTLGTLKKRRKLMNKQRTRLCSSNRCFESSSSSEENFDIGANEVYARACLKHQRRKLPALCAASLRTHQMGKGAASLARACPTVPRNLRLKNKLMGPLRPRKRASECCCFKEAKLCKLTEHLADTSTEDWIVENCDSPKKLNSAKLKTPNKRKEVNEVTEANKPANIKKKNKKITAIAKKVENKVKNKKLRDSFKESPLESTFELELRQVIELSKQTFKEETKIIKSEQKTKKKKTKNTKLQAKEKMKLSLASEEAELKSKSEHNVEIPGDAANSCEQFEKDMKFEIEQKTPNNAKLPKKSFTKQKAIELAPETPKEKKKTKSALEITDNNQNKDLNQENEQNVQNDKNGPKVDQLPVLSQMLTSVIDDISPARLGLKPQPKSAKLKKIKKLTEQGLTITAIKNDTFYSQADKICNSTAMVHDAIALKKQFSSERDNSLPTTTTAAATTTRNTVEDPDCTIVSSSTDTPIQPRKLANSILTSSIKRNGDILLHTPHNHALAPQHSCSDGVFSLTEDHLSTLIGAKEARKFMKYYIGRRRFGANLTVYYRPPDRHRNTDSNDDDSDSDVDGLEQIDQIGEIYAFSEK